MTIAIDGKYGVPLRVQVFAKGAASPAFQFGYTALQFAAPAPANYDFTPPPGASVTVPNLASNSSKSAAGQQSGTSGFGAYGTELAHGRGTPAARSNAGIWNERGFLRHCSGYRQFRPGQRDGR